LEIFNVFSIEPLHTSIENNSTDDLILSFRLINETDTNRNPMEVTKSELSIMILGEAVAQEDYYVNYDDGFNNVIISSQAIRFNDFELILDISKSNFKSSYIDEKLETTFDVVINQVTPTTPPPGTELPPYLIGIIIGGAIGFIGLVSVIAVVGSRKGRKRETIVDVSRSSDYVSLFENVLTLRKLLFIENESSLPVFEYDIAYSNTVDTALISGFLSVVASMGEQIGGIGTGGIKKLEYRNFVVNTAAAEKYSVFLFSSKEITNIIAAQLFDLMMWFEFTFSFEGTWNGKMEPFVTKTKIIQDKIAESLYLWIFFPLVFDVKKQKEIKKLKDVNSRVVDFIAKSGSVTISSLITKYKNVDLDDILRTVFTLVNKGFLLRQRFV
ncbi:MAG: hypothetical protein KGD64_15120, partial [Candidatus Heimdallarchaeota archaeon]|nr:hypothetical protein [Candidatus Heimdallarchaeota archaeon]